MSDAAFKNLLAGYSLEVTPKFAESIANFTAYFAKETAAYVTFLPNSDFLSTIRATVLLQQNGLRTVPHIAARSLHSEVELEQGLAQLYDAGVRDLLLIAGSIDQPRGPWASTLALLASGIVQNYQWHSIGFAAHPEGHPHIGADELLYTLQQKQAFADSISAQCYLLTQFCFTAKPIVHWHRMLQTQGIRLPIHLGVPGVTTIGNLFRYAQLCGIGNSVRFLRYSQHGLHQFLELSTPELLLSNIVRARAQGELSLLKCLHFYPLGGFEATVRWIHQFQQSDDAEKTP